ncbi:3'-5' exonuclease [Campylobacter sp. MIT 97-5078]|uniref:3'-5' exonuclease n=1 Tax=Campylobacter sp. MIT 97-5078 TaxID=1548153 RepID=UPI000B187904|nr:3'-5' exonuclease [Campylobacter sp. MIT 97-5078]
MLCGKKERIQNAFISRFNNVKELIAYSDESKEIDLKQKLLICFKYMGENIFELIKKIKTSVVKDPTKAHLILSTGHKSKGLEWDRVEIIDDFINLREMLEENSNVEITKEELNLFYVALTRSKAELIVDRAYLLDDKFLKYCKDSITIT